jgi:hypothetical protein
MINGNDRITVWLDSRQKPAGMTGNGCGLLTVTGSYWRLLAVISGSLY